MRPLSGHGTASDLVKAQGMSFEWEACETGVQGASRLTRMCPVENRESGVYIRHVGGLCLCSESGRCEKGDYAASLRQAVSDFAFGPFLRIEPPARQL